MFFSTSAIASKSCRNAFVFYVKQTFTRLTSPILTTALLQPDAIEFSTGMDAYIILSNVAFKGDMQKAYFTVLKILGEEKFMQLGWRLFNGTTLEYETVRKILIDPESGHVKSNYIGHDKLKKFAFVHFGDIPKAYMRAEEALDPVEFAVLGWEKHDSVKKDEDNRRTRHMEFVNGENAVREDQGSGGFTE